MSKDEIIEMARQAGFEEISKNEWAKYTNSLEAFAKLVADVATAKEREACAKVADEWSIGWPHPSTVIAETIRARGEA